MAVKKMVMVITMAVFVTVSFLSDSHALEITYTYDALNRITAAAYQSNSKTTTLSYQYDAAGNRTAYTVTGAESGTIHVNPEPDAMNASAPWTMTGSSSYSRTGTGDLTISNLTPGDYTLTWGDVNNGWTKPSPASSSQTLATDGTVTFIGTYTSTGIPQIQITPSPLSFGYVPPGSYKDLTLEVKNIGTGTLTGTVNATPPFSILSGGSYSLGANQSQQIVVRYTAPLQKGSHTGSLTFTGGGGITIQVKGSNQKVGLPWLMLLLGN
jgi:YD repeat-containing protein